MAAAAVDHSSLSLYKLAPPCDLLIPKRRPRVDKDPEGFTFKGKVLVFVLILGPLFTYIAVSIMD